MTQKQQAEQNLIDSEALKQVISALPRSNSWGGSNIIRPAKTNQIIPAYTDTELTVEGDADLLPQNIRKGINLFGVAGAMDPGIDILKLTGYTKMSIVKKAFASYSELRNTEINHGLGVIPSFMILLTNITKVYSEPSVVFGAWGSTGGYSTGGGASLRYSRYYSYFQTDEEAVDLDSTKAKFRDSAIGSWASGQEYTFIFLA